MPLDGRFEMRLPVGASQRSDQNQARLRQAFDQHHDGVWRFLRRMGFSPDRADDAAQQVFLVAVEALGRIAEGKERGFLYGTAFRLALGLRRGDAREVPSASMEWESSTLPSPDQLADRRRARTVLDGFVASLDIDTRTVFVLTEFEEFTAPEIAELLDVPLGTVASRLRRAREKFRATVKRIYGREP